MSKDISLFSGYNQRENRTTNYCLLVLKMIYEENPKFLSEVLSAIIDEYTGSQVGVSFLQQQRQAASIPDGLIIQKPLAVCIETKNYAMFPDDQLERHLTTLVPREGKKVLIALGNFDSSQDGGFERIREVIRKNHGDSIVFAPVSFADFLLAVQTPLLPKNLTDTITDFGAYLNDQNLLTTWRGWLDVINCATLPDDILVWQVYMCPAIGGAYNHGRCEYFGMYRRKRVERVALIRGVVDLESATSAEMKWSNDGTSESELISEARHGHQGGRPEEYPTRVFVLGTLHETDFIKDTPGGMMGSKQYFNVSNLGANDAAELGERLRGRTWTELLS